MTQLSVAGEPRNTEDFLYQRIAPERRHLVTADFIQRPGAGAKLSAGWDIVLDETPV